VLSKVGGSNIKYNQTLNIYSFQCHRKLCPKESLPKSVMVLSKVDSPTRESTSVMVLECTSLSVFMDDYTFVHPFYFKLSFLNI